MATDNFFDIERVNEIRLIFSQSNWDEILDSLYARGEEERLIGLAVINGVIYDSVGVRFKGHSSYNPNRRKNPFNIKLDYIRTGQNIDGHGTLRLANVYKDPSFVREVLSYEIARKYTPASRANFTNIYVNDTLIGLYTNNEDVDKLFMRKFFYCDENARFKGQMINDSVPLIGWKYLGADSTPYFDYFELESDSGWRELISFLDTLNNQSNQIEKVLNIDQHLWMLAFDVLMVNLDAPVNMPQNFYLYRDASARFNPILWDLNENFGAFRDLVGTGQLTLTQMQQLDPFLRSTDINYPICSKILSSQRYRRIYVAHMKTIISDMFSNNWYEDRALEIQDIIDTHVQADPNKFYSYNDFLNNITRSVGSGPLAIVGLTELMNTRIAFVLNRPEFQASSPLISEVSHSPNSISPNTYLQFFAQVEGADSVFLGFRQNPAWRFMKTVMYDDGEHRDSNAGDGLYATTVSIGTGEINYYIYAENAEAATFLPTRAEKEFFTLPVAGGLVINELLAINNNTVPDPNGQYDDWIEFFNNTNYTISLDGFLLTDDSTNLTKWEFPDITIPTHGYLIVWADNDLNQPGLHANFKLSGSGSTLILSDPDGEQIDRIIYGPQTADISFGRYPNGIGSFILMNPTFGTENVSGIGITENKELVSNRLIRGASPNPFIHSTIIQYNLPSLSSVTLRIYNVNGRLIATLIDGTQNSGSHQVKFSPGESKNSEGIYFAQLIVRTSTSTNSIENIKLIYTK